jgi:hypothetical protein
MTATRKCPEALRNETAPDRTENAADSPGPNGLYEYAAFHFGN